MCLIAEVGRVGRKLWSYNAKILRNWVDPDPKYSGYFTQRNADNYAFFALAKYVEGQIGKYPSVPSPGRKKPTAEPRNAADQSPLRIPAAFQSQDVDLIDGDEQDPPPTVYPGCPGKYGLKDDPAVVFEDQGNLYCRAIHGDGDPQFYFNMGGAIDAIRNFCDAAVSSSVILGAGGQALFEVAENDGFNHNLDIAAEWVQGPDCPPPMDFTQDGASITCQERLTNVIDHCDQFVRNSTNWKQGGKFFRDCIVADKLQDLEMPNGSDGGRRWRAG